MGRTRRSAAPLAAASFAALLTACVTAASSAGSPDPPDLTPSHAPDPATTAGAQPRPDHVVIVVLENKEQREVMAEASVLSEG